MAGNQPGWERNDDMWQLYANSVAEGSAEQLRAALTKSIPVGFLDEFKNSSYFKGRGVPDIQGFLANKRGITTAELGDPTKNIQRTDDDYVRNYSQSLRKKMADEYRQKYTDTVDQGVANLREGANDALQDDFSGIDRSANQRGLLFSGKRVSQRGSAAQRRASELAPKVQQYEAAVADTQSDLDNSVNDGLIAESLRKSAWGDIESGQFYNRLRKQLGGELSNYQTAGTIGQGVGTAAGTMYGGRK